MMYGDQRHPKGQSHRFGKIDPHQHRPDQAGRIADRHGIDILFGKPRILQCLVRQPGNGLHMLSGSDFRYYPAIDGMHIHLGGNGVRKDFSAVSDHRHSSLVAGGLKGQNVHPITLFLLLCAIFSILPTIQAPDGSPLRVPAEAGCTSPYVRPKNSWHRYPGAWTLPFGRRSLRPDKYT